MSINKVFIILYATTININHTFIWLSKVFRKYLILISLTSWLTMVQEGFMITTTSFCFPQLHGLTTLIFILNPPQWSQHGKGDSKGCHSYMKIHPNVAWQLYCTVWCFVQLALGYMQLIATYLRAVISWSNLLILPLEPNNLDWLWTTLYKSFDS